MERTEQSCKTCRYNLCVRHTPIETRCKSPVAIQEERRLELEAIESLKRQLEEDKIRAKQVDLRRRARLFGGPKHNFPQ